ncbi:MAG: hypothetical protein U0270_16265 [Labilithrix sp.]
MSEPQRGPERLFASDDPLLLAAREDAPPGDLEARILAGMGGGGGGAPPSSGGLGAKIGLGIGGAIGIGVLAWVLGGTSVTPVATPAPIATPVPIETPAPVATTASSVVTATATETPLVTPAPAKIEEAPPKAEAPPVSLRAKASASVVASATPAPAASAASGLGAEIKALDAVRASMSAGDASGALAALDAYDRSFPRGTLQQEAVLLRIDALMRAGRTDEARKLGHAFLAEHPSTPHRKRILTLLREGD